MKRIRSIGIILAITVALAACGTDPAPLGSGDEPQEAPIETSGGLGSDLAEGQAADPCAPGNESATETVVAVGTGGVAPDAPDTVQGGETPDLQARVDMLDKVNQGPGQAGGDIDCEPAPPPAGTETELPGE